MTSLANKIQDVFNEPGCDKEFKANPTDLSMALENVLPRYAASFPVCRG